MIQIREGLIKDIEFIVESQIQMAKETEDLPLSRETLSKGVKAVFENSSLGKYYIAESDNQPVGMLLTVPEWSDWRNGTVLWIHSVYIIKTFRQKGVYKIMYKHLQKKVLEDSSLKGIRLYVDKSNQKAQQVYTKLGMNNQHYDLYEWMT